MCILCVQERRYTATLSHLVHSDRVPLMTLSSVIIVICLPRDYTNIIYKITSHVKD